MTDVDIDSPARPLEHAVRRAIESFEGPLERFLIELLDAVGAKRIHWLERDQESLDFSYRLAASASERAVSGGPNRRMDRSLLTGLEAGEVRPYHASRLSGSGPSRAAGLERLVLACDPKERGVLWIENPSRALLAELQSGPVGGAGLRAAAGLCAARTEFALAQVREKRDAHLVRRGVGALALAHDLRHQLSLALLLTRRLRESEDSVSRERAADELDAALSKARGVCEDAMSGTETDESSVLRALR
ncbi:MAG: hypothetical protein AAF368_18550, partial [Planctomycetota bacterium]